MGLGLNCSCGTRRGRSGSDPSPSRTTGTQLVHYWCTTCVTGRASSTFPCGWWRPRGTLSHTGPCLRWLAARWTSSVTTRTAPGERSHVRKLECLLNKMVITLIVFCHIVQTKLNWNHELFMFNYWCKVFQNELVLFLKMFQHLFPLDSLFTTS